MHLHRACACQCIDTYQLNFPSLLYIFKHFPPLVTRVLRLAAHTLLPYWPTLSLHGLGLRIISAHLVSHSVDAGPSVKDGELDRVVGFPDEVQIALVVLVSFARHADQRLTAADDHRLVLPVDP